MIASVTIHFQFFPPHTISKLWLMLSKLKKKNSDLTLVICNVIFTTLYYYLFLRKAFSSFYKQKDVHWYWSMRLVNLNVPSVSILTEVWISAAIISSIFICWNLSDGARALPLTWLTACQKRSRPAREAMDGAFEQIHKYRRLHHTQTSKYTHAVS